MSTRAACRRFRLSDAMILVAGLAVGLAVLRAFLDSAGKERSWSDEYPTFIRHVDRGVTVSAPVLAGLSLAWLVIRLLPPRPGIRQLFRQPGFVAGVATAIILALRLLYLGPVAAFGFSRYWVMILYRSWTEIGVAVLVAWVILLMSGRRRPEPGWIDRTGRTLGACWIAIVLVKSSIGPWFEPPPPPSLGSFPIFMAPGVPSTNPPPRPPVPPSMPPVPGILPRSAADPAPPMLIP